MAFHFDGIAYDDPKRVPRHVTQSIHETHEAFFLQHLPRDAHLDDIRRRLMESISEENRRRSLRPENV